MEYLISLISLIKYFKPFKVLKIIAITSLPLWVTYAYFPNTYVDIKILFFIPDTPEWIPTTILRIFSILLFFNKMFLIGLLLVLSGYTIQMTIKRVLNLFSIYMPENNKFRKWIKVFFMQQFIKVVLYTVGVAIFSDLLLGYDVPIKILLETNYYWYFILPFKSFVFILILSLIIPN